MPLGALFPSPGSFSLVEEMQIASTDEAPSDVPGRICLALYLSVFMVLQLRRWGFREKESPTQDNLAIKLQSWDWIWIQPTRPQTEDFSCFSSDANSQLYQNSGSLLDRCPEYTRLKPKWGGDLLGLSALSMLLSAAFWENWVMAVGLDPLFLSSLSSSSLNFPPCKMCIVTSTLNYFMLQMRLK